MKCDCLLYPSRKATCDCHEEVSEPFDLGIEEMELRRYLEGKLEYWQKTVETLKKRKKGYDARQDWIMSEIVDAQIKIYESCIIDIEVAL